MEVKAYKIPKSIDKEYSTVENLFICSDEDLGEPEETMVDGMIKAINLEKNKDIKILKLGKDEEALVSSPDSSIKVVIIFGINPKRLGFNIQIKPYKIYPTEAMSIILCHKLSTIRADKTKKMTLWKLLQHIYLNK